MLKFIRENAPYAKRLFMIIAYCQRGVHSYLDIAYCTWCYSHAYDYCTCNECYENKDYIDGN